MINIFEYVDFREYLRDCYQLRKKEDRKFSHRWLCNQLGLATSNFVMLVMQGKRNLNTFLCMGLSDIFRHSAKEREYFQIMVMFGQAKTHAEKNQHFMRMMAARKKVKVGKIDEYQYEYYSNWYNPIVRELVCNPKFKGNPQAIARQIVPPVTAVQVKRSIELLLKIGLIKRQMGKYVQQEAHITTDPQVNSVAVLNFHKKMGQLAVISLDKVGKQERNVSSSTLCVSTEAYNGILKKIAEFHEDILSLAVDAQSSERVYQLNLQLFPVTKKKENRT